jgi:hypothetical protein
MADEEKKAPEGIPAPSEIETIAEEPVEIAGYKILPWGIRQISQLSPAMGRIYMRMKEQEIKFESVAQDMPKLIFCIMPEAADILRVTLKISDEEVEKIPQEHLMDMIAFIINANLPYLKNWIRLATSLVRGATKAG